MHYKVPESVLVVIHTPALCADTGSVTIGHRNLSGGFDFEGLGGDIERILAFGHRVA